MAAASHEDGLATKVPQAKTKCDRPAAPNRWCLKLLVLNTQLDCVIDEFGLSPCSVEHLSSGVFPFAKLRPLHDS